MSDLNQGTWAENIGNTAPKNNTEQMSATNKTTAAQGTLQTWSPQNCAVLQGEQAKETEETKRLKDNFGFFGPATFLYAVFYAFCMYRNRSGVTFPFFVAGSFLLLYFSLSKLGTTLKRGSVFYMAAMLLLGISTFCTDDGRLIFFNKLGIFLLMMSLLLNQFFNTSGWKLGKYLLSICQMAVSCFGELERSVTDSVTFWKKWGINIDKKVWYAVLGLVIAVPVLLIALLLLASADVVFRQMTGYFLVNIQLRDAILVILQIVAVYFATYALTAFLCKRNIKETVPDRRKGEPVLAITVTGLLTLLYLLFSFIQIGGLFLGKMQLPQGYSYAMYAREGFFQLLAVSLFNLVIVLVCMSYFKESRLLKGIMTVMSLCTFIMIASSALRMVIYIRFYYLTFLRILVLWSLAVLALLFVGVMISIFRDRFHLFRYSMTVVTVMYLALSFAHPDYIIARVNVSNAPQQGINLWTEEESLKATDNFSRADMFSGRFFLAAQPYHDYSYLAGLSADAAPILIPYLEELGYDMGAFYKDSAAAYANILSEDGVYRGGKDGFGYYWMERMQSRTENLGIRTFNLSRFWVVQGFK